MAEKQFIWLADDCYDGYLNTLKRGETYAARIVPEHVLEEWVKTGAAQIVTAKAGKAKTGEED